MGETRPGKYGRNLAIWVNYTISAIPKSCRAEYRSRFLAELKNYSFAPRRKGTPINSGCIYELESIVACDVTNPEDLAKLVKEGIHLLYQKQTAAKVIVALLENVAVHP
jgi:hypothetical protein